MSKDIRLAHSCPHETLEERVFLSADRRSLPTRQPVASQSSTRILADDIPIPSYGLLTQAQLTSFRSGPYRIVGGENNLVVSNRVRAIPVEFPLDQRMDTDRLVQILNVAFNNSFMLAENVNGHLVITDMESSGHDSEVSVSGTALSALGFSQRRRSVGRVVYPGWGMGKRPDTISNRFPKFLSPVRGNPVFKVSYTVPPQRCLRCGGVGVENDWRPDSHGDVVMVENESLLHQASLKILLTTKGSNPHHSWYGTSVRSRVGAKAIGAVSVQIDEDIRRGLETMQRQQDQQRKFQPVSPAERLATIESVTTTPSRHDPTTFLVEVVVRNASRRQVVLQTVYTTPGVLAFLNDERKF